MANTPNPNFTKSCEKQPPFYNKKMNKMFISWQNMIDRSPLELPLIASAVHSEGCVSLAITYEMRCFSLQYQLQLHIF